MKKSFAIVSLFCLALGLMLPVSIQQSNDQALAVASVTAVRATAGYTHGCAVMSDGSVRCWGGNTAGQLGDGTTVGSKATVVSGITNAVAVGVNPGNYESSHRSCALLASGQIRCWGINFASSRSHLGTGDTVASYRSPVPVCVTGSYSANTCIPLTNVIQMSIDAYGGCGLVSTDASITSDNRVYCWGETGSAAGTYNAVPVCTSGIFTSNNCVQFQGAIEIDGNKYHRCARTSDSKAYCWGSNINAQLGRESATPSSSWIAAAIREGGSDITDVLDIVTGGDNTCIIRPPVSPSTVNRIQCVGERYYGHLGNGKMAETGFVSNWTGICGHDRAVPDSSQPCSTTVLPGSATDLRGGSNTMCAYIANGYGTNDSGWSCWSGAGADHLARPSWSTGNVYGYIGQLCNSAGTYSVNGECASGKRFAATEVDMTGSTYCGVVTGNVYCWGMGQGGSILGQSGWVNYPSLISFGRSLRFAATPSGIFPGTAMSQQPRVQLVSETGVDTQTAGVTVTASLVTISGTATLGGTLTSVTNAQGIADFSDLQISATGNYILQFATSAYGNLGVSVVVVVDNAAPTLTSGTLNANGTTVVLTFNETLHATTAPASAFTVTASAVNITPTSVVVNGSTVILTLPSTIGPSATVTVAYVAPASNSATSNSAVQDLSGNDAASFSNRSVTNNSIADVVAPTASWTEPSTPSSSRTLSYTLTFSESVSGLASGDFSFTGTATGCTATPAASTANVSVSISVTCSTDGTVIIRLAPNSVTDAALNTGPSSAALASSVTINATIPTSSTTTPTGTVAPTQATVPSTGVTVPPAGNASPSGTVAQGVGSTGISTTTTSIAPSTTTTTLPAVDVPEVADGGGALVIGGKRIEATITRENNQLVIAAGVLRARISAVQREGGRAPLDSQGRIRMDQGDSIEIEVTGFGSGSQVEVRMYSDPVLLGRSTVSALGNLMASYEVPESVDDGRHTVVLLGESQSQEELTFALSVYVGDEASGPSTLAILVGIPLGLAVIAGLVIPAIIRRRREREEQVA
jgi:hypothetical protein